MLYFANWKVLLICGACLVGVLLSLPNLFTPAQLSYLPHFIPKKQVALGLDLRGGSYLLLHVDVDAAQRERLNSITDSVRNTLRDAHIGYTGLNVEGDAITFTIRDTDRIEEAKRALAKDDPDLVVEIAPDGTGTMKFSTVATETRRRQAVEQSIEIIRRRIDETGTKEPTIQREGQDRILVQLPGVDNPERVKQLLGRTAKLTFQLVDQSVTVEDARRGRLPPGDEILPGVEEGRARGSSGAGSYVVRKRIMVGADSIHAGTVASIVGVALVIIFMVLFYGLFGVFADIALFFNLCLMMAALSLLGATLTLPGIAGIALTMGMAVDANVLIYERIKEELRSGRTVLSSLEAGFTRAFGTILDSHVTTLVAGILLYWLGSGPVKGFAVTLSIGVLTSLFSAILVTRLQIVTWLRRYKPKAIPL